MDNATPPRADFASDVMKLVSGTAFGQIAVYAVTPLLIHFFSPEAFGEFAIFVAGSGTLGMVACLRYELAVVLPSNDREAAGLLWLCFVLACISGVLGVAAAAILDAAGWWAARDRGWLLYLIPVSGAVSGIGLAANYWNTRRRRYGRIAWSRFANRLGCSGTQAASGGVGVASPTGLIVPYVLGNVVAAAILLADAFRHDMATLRRGLSFRGIVRAAKRYRRFPLFNTWAGLLNHFAWQLPALMLACFYSKEIAGYYLIADMLLRTPLSLVGASLSQVFYQRITDAGADERRVAEIVSGVHARLVGVCVTPLALIVVAGPSLFRCCFEQQWQPAALYAQILAVRVFFWFTSSPMSQFYDARERHRMSLGVNALVGGSRAAALLLGGLLLTDPAATVGLLALVSSLVYGWFGTRVLRDAGVPLSGLLPRFGGVLTAAALCVAPVIVVRLATGSDGATVAIALLAGVAHAVWLIRRDVRIRGAALQVATPLLHWLRVPATSAGEGRQ